MNIALYTTIYPGVECFLEAWKQSVLKQSNQNFEIWVGVDGFSLDRAKKLLSGLEVKQFFISKYPNLKAYVRKTVLAEMVRLYDVIVLVDSDDVLEESRVCSASHQLNDYDVIGCAMSLIDEQGHDLGVSFGRKEAAFQREDIIQYNQFGLSNTAYRSDLLKECLEVSNECELLDWFLITNALFLGARAFFDPVKRMQYRQHPKNFTKVQRPFNSDDIKQASVCVLKHFDFLLQESKVLQTAQRKMIEARKNEVLHFSHLFSDPPHLLKKYVEAFNVLSQDNLWWSCVANVCLEALWNQ